MHAGCPPFVRGGTVAGRLPIMSAKNRQITVPEFAAMKSAGRKITMITAYDYAMAGLVDAAEIDGVLVGDSLSMVVQGHENTLPVTLDEMIYHAEMVGRAVNHALTVVDMPFPSFHLGACKAVENAGRILKENPLPSGQARRGRRAGPESSPRWVSAGIPVMAHCGLRPQSVHQLGGYRIQRNEPALLADAKAAEAAGAFSIVLECIPAETADRITQAVKIPTIGIGAGTGCDGQVLVLNDLLGPEHRLCATPCESIRRSRQNDRRRPGPISRRCPRGPLPGQGTYVFLIQSRD